MSSGVLRGNAAGLIASAFFGASVVATRAAGDHVPPFSLAVLRFGQGGIILFAALALFRRDDLRIGRADLRRIAVLGFLLYGLFPLGFNGALRLTTASRGAVVLATMPLWSAILARRAGRESLTVRQLAGVAISMAGVVAVMAESFSLEDGSRALIGNLMLAATAIIGALYGVLAKPVLARHSAMPVTAYAMLAGSAILLPIALIEGLPNAVVTMDRSTALQVLYLGVVGGAIGYALMTYSLSHLTPTQATAYINVNPVVATALGALLLEERLTPWFGVGFALVATGLVLANWPGGSPQGARTGISEPAVERSAR